MLEPAPRLPPLARRFPAGRCVVVVQENGDTWLALDDGDRRLRVDVDGVSPGWPIASRDESLSLELDIAEAIADRLNRRPVVTLVGLDEVRDAA